MIKVTYESKEVEQVTEEAFNKTFTMPIDKQTKEPLYTPAEFVIYCLEEYLRNQVKYYQKEVGTAALSQLVDSEPLKIAKHSLRDRKIAADRRHQEWLQAQADAQTDPE